MANEATEKFIDTIRKAAEAYSDQLASAALRIVSMNFSVASLAMSPLRDVS